MTVSHFPTSRAVLILPAVMSPVISSSFCLCGVMHSTELPISRQLGRSKRSCVMLGGDHLVFWPSHDNQTICSYDLDLDTRLAEETTVLVESYTVLSFGSVARVASSLSRLCSSLMVASLRSAKSGSRLQSACSNPISWTWINRVSQVSNFAPIVRREAQAVPHRDALLHYPVRCSRYPNGTVQTRRPLRWFKHVSRTTLSP